MRVGGFGGQRGGVAVERGDDGLDCFLAEFPREMRAALGAQRGDIGAGGVAGAACGDGGFEPVEDVVSHAAHR